MYGLNVPEPVQVLIQSLSNFVQFDRLGSSLDPRLGFTSFPERAKGVIIRLQFGNVRYQVTKRYRSTLGRNQQHAEIDMKRTWSTYPVMTSIRTSSVTKWPWRSVDSNLERCPSGPWKPVATSRRIAVTQNIVKHCKFNQILGYLQSMVVKGGSSMSQCRCKVRKMALTALPIEYKNDWK